MKEKMKKKGKSKKNEDFSSFSQLNTQNNNEFHKKNNNLTEKKINRNILKTKDLNKIGSPSNKNNKIGKKDQVKYNNNILSSSIENKLNQNNQVKRPNKRYNNQYNLKNSQKPTQNQIQNHSFQKMIPNSMTLNNNSEKNAIVPIRRNLSENNIGRDEELKSSSLR